MNKEHIISEIKRTAEENHGVPLGQRRFEKETGIKQWDWCGKYWSRWNDAVKEAGYSPNVMQSAYDDDFLIQKLIEFFQDEELDHFPTAPELRLKAYQEKNFPNQKTFSRFGNKNELIQTVLKYCESHNIENKDKLIEICMKSSTKKSFLVSSDKDEKESDSGFVYLMKSGKHYKIGRSNCAERREFELKILLPEKLELIHKIKTDDPVGIEKYWHYRFKEKRMGGEWFELNAKDISSFKRRKFM